MRCKYMKKIPTAFIRVFDDHHRIIEVKPLFSNENCRKAVLYGIPTIKYDGAACAVIKGELYKRYDCKNKTVPEGAVLCQNVPDEITGSFPVWVRCNRDKPQDKWFFAAFDNYEGNIKHPIQTFEAIGKHFNGNPYNLFDDFLVKHGACIINDNLYDYGNIKNFLKNHLIEGIVYWLNGDPVCKIKRSDFGFEWPVKEVSTK